MEKITLTYLNIRQSISILLIKLIVLDIIFALIVIGFYFVIVQGGELTEAAAASPVVFLIVFAAIGVVKILLTIYIVLLWLNEYYEITPEHVVHKKGIIKRTSEIYELNKVRSIDVQGSLLGEIFNFATVTLYDIRMRKYLDLYLIHNPQRYVKILRTLKPDLEKKSGYYRLPFLPKPEDFEEEKS